VNDLIGEPYTKGGHDCRWATAEGLMRLGMSDASESISRMGEIRDSNEDWRRLRDEKPIPGDVLLNIPADDALHLGVLMDNGRVLTSAPGIGVYTVPANRMLGVVVYYRYVG